MGWAAPGVSLAEELALQTPAGRRVAIVDRVGEGPRPTVIVLHGALIGAVATEKDSTFAEAAKKFGFTAVYPEGVGKLWSDGRKDGRRNLADDVAYLSALGDILERRGVASPGQVFVVGISNGGMMTLRLACEAGENFAGFGIVIASQPAYDGKCRYPRAPYVFVAGDADPIIPYNGGLLGKDGSAGAVMGVERTAGRIAKTLKCGPPRVAPQSPAAPGDPPARHLIWGCRSGSSVAVFRLIGAGHQMPGGKAWSQNLLGPSAGLFPAARVIVETFAASLPPPPLPPVREK